MYATINTRITFSIQVKLPSYWRRQTETLPIAYPFCDRKEKKENAIPLYKKDLMYPCSGCYINHAPHSRRRHL